ncbi:MAG TPA: hypothetical protein VN830_09260 [Verrucomicrobiae bacterium]|nr:hypothetical protein [Verrucomicrobiae bacterium]
MVEVFSSSMDGGRISEISDQISGGEEKKKTYAEITEGTEYTEKRRKKREGAVLERKSPPFAEKREGWGTLKYVVGQRNKGGWEKSGGGIPPLRGPTRQKAARRQKSGRSGRDARFGRAAAITKANAVTNRQRGDLGFGGRVG